MDLLCGNKWPLTKNRCNQPCLKWRKGARDNVKWGPNKAKKDQTEVGSKLRTRSNKKRTAKNLENKQMKKPRKVIRLKRKSTSPPISQRKGPPENIPAAPIDPPKPTDEVDSTSNFVPSVIVNPVLYGDVTGGQMMRVPLETQRYPL